jgi:hypothetical protein
VDGFAMVGKLSSGRVAGWRSGMMLREETGGGSSEEKQQKTNQVELRSDRCGSSGARS